MQRRPSSLIIGSAIVSLMSAAAGPACAAGPRSISIPPALSMLNTNNSIMSSIMAQQQAAASGALSAQRQEQFRAEQAEPQDASAGSEQTTSYDQPTVRDTRQTYDTGFSLPASFLAKNVQACFAHHATRYPAATRISGDDEANGSVAGSKTIYAGLRDGKVQGSSCSLGVDQGGHPVSAHFSAFSTNPLTGGFGKGLEINYHAGKFEVLGKDLTKPAAAQVTANYYPPNPSFAAAEAAVQKAVKIYGTPGTHR